MGNSTDNFAVHELSGKKYALVVLLCVWIKVAMQ